MPSPLRIHRRLALAFVVPILALGACEPAAPPAPPPAPPAPEPKPAPAPPLPVAALGRAELLDALDAAASAYAAGAAEPAGDLAGRRFVVRQAFGCSGPASADAERQDGVAQLAWDARRRALELTLRPADWTEDPVAAADAWEAVEGYWLIRPWLHAEGCPAVRPPAETPADAPAPPKAEAAPAPSPAPALPHTAGLAAVFEQGGSRLGRQEGRPFRHTIRGDPPPVPPAAGYRLVLEGRFAAPPDGRVIRCRADGPDTRPVCIAAAEVDRIAFENAEGEVLSEWRRG